ncbi:uncharacterized protein LOC124166803 [Ischnura elegans]|uniref:uncharacterized protein LOC124166803 n=1 Tax=Ischnura elegans TaxID=197161 RepID=UPI001ED8ADB6|nr:uncharacterized protein LOC124166803 [Ischnura elegans]
MRIDTEDMTFARQIHGTRVAYGEAGDCYSSLDCPQGRFSVNLKGTGLRVHSSMEWEGHGSGAAVHVSRKDDGGGKVWWLLWSLPPSRSTMDSARHNAKRWRWPLLTTNNCQTCVFSQGRQEDVAQPLNALKPLSSCMNVMEQRTPLERWQSER